MFDIRYQKDHFAAQPISVGFNFHETRPVANTDNTTNALMITNRLVNINSDGRKMFDLI